ncbi:MAG: histidine kinase [Lewinellaceae bacterium]|nr:histidine kinase [Lewinellaceae bacterium]
MITIDEKEIGLNDKKLRLWGVPLVAVTGLLSLMQFFFQGNWDLFWKYLFASLLYTWIAWELCRLVLYKIRRFIPGLENTVKRLATTIFYFFIIAGIGNAIVKFILLQLDLKPPSMANKSFFEWWLLNMPNILFFVLLLSSVYEAFYFFSQYKLAIQKAELLKRQQAQKKLDALKSRVNPHFLFNSLTTLSALIGEDTQLAEQFVNELSKVYRYLLRAGRQPEATLGDELQFAKSYTYLLKNRFEAGAFSFSDGIGDLHSTHQKEAMAQNIPALSFQNALEFLVRTQHTPLHIQVNMMENQLRIVCENRPKVLSVDVNDTDWQQLEANGAQKEIQAGNLSILIPFISNSLSK